MATTYIRPKDKSEIYVESLMKKYGNCSVSMGLHSRYYTVNHKVLRISDHIGVTNDAHVSIIVPSFRSDDQQYIIHAHKNGQISVVPYEKVKEMIRSFFYLSSIFGEMTTDRGCVVGDDKEEKVNVNKLMEKLSELEKYRNKAISKDKMVLGIPLTKFQKGQVDSIVAIVNKVKRQIEAEG